MKFLPFLVVLGAACSAGAQPPQRVPDLRQLLERYHAQAGQPAQDPRNPPPAAAEPGPEPRWQPRQLSPEERAELRRQLADFGQGSRRQR